MYTEYSLCGSVYALFSLLLFGFTRARQPLLLVAIGRVQCHVVLVYVRLAMLQQPVLHVLHDCMYCMAKVRFHTCIVVFSAGWAAAVIFVHSFQVRLSLVLGVLCGWLFMVGGCLARARLPGQGETAWPGRDCLARARLPGQGKTAWPGQDCLARARLPGQGKTAWPGQDCLARARLPGQGETVSIESEIC